MLIILICISMKYIFLLGFCFALTLSVSAQQEQPTIAFPFNFTLFTPDSTPIQSVEVLKTGKPTVLAFWLTTCIPCMNEFAAYSQNLSDWKKQVDFNLVGISIDYQPRFRRIKELAQEKKWPFPVYWDRERNFKNILPGGLNGLPQVFVFDREGKLVWQHKGYYPGAEAETWGKVQEAAKLR